MEVQRRFTDLVRRWFPAFLFGYLAVWHFSGIFRYAVDVPYWDEWDVWWGWEKDGVLPWLFQTHNEHQIVFTKILILLSNWLDQSNFAHLVYLGFFLYLGYLALIYRVGKQFVSPRQNGFLILAVCMQLSCLPHENLQWAFQSQFHFVMLFYLAGALMLFATDRIFLGGLLLVCAIFSLSCGVVQALVVLAVFCARELLFGFRERASWLRVAGLVALLGVGILGFKLGYHRPDFHGEMVWPIEWRFYDFFFNLLSLGFGVHARAWGWALLCAPVLIVPQVLAYRRLSDKNDSGWLLLALTLATLAVLATIAMARAGFSENLCKESRYAELASLLGPLSLFGWARAFQDKPQLLPRVLWAVLFFLFAGSFDNWRTGLYIHIHNRQEEGRICLKRAMDANLPQIQCPTIAPYELSTRIAKACRHNVGFCAALKKE
jgi:hypothetical protein